MQTHMQGLCPLLGVNAGEQLRASVERSNLTTTPVTKERWKDSVRVIKAAFPGNSQTNFVQRSDHKHYRVQIRTLSLDYGYYKGHLNFRKKKQLERVLKQ